MVLYNYTNGSPVAKTTLPTIHCLCHSSVQACLAWAGIYQARCTRLEQGAHVSKVGVYARAKYNSGNWLANAEGETEHFLTRALTIYGYAQILTKPQISAYCR